MAEYPNLITDAIKALIGFEGEPMESCDPIDRSEVRRFHHAIMDMETATGERVARLTESGALTVPPIFPTFFFRRGLNEPDPLDALQERPNYDGLDHPFRNLPRVPVPLTRILNGGYEYFFFRSARIGERIFRRSRFRDIYQRNGKEGPLIFAVIDDLYYGEKNDLIVAATQSIVIR